MAISGREVTEGEIELVKGTHARFMMLTRRLIGAGCSHG
jgi:hypothetical protein